MNKIILHIRIWNQWRKHNLNSKLHKFLVLIGWIKSPTMLGYYIDFGIREGIKELEDFMTNNEIADMITEANENRKKTSENWTKEKYDTTNKIIDKIRRGEAK